MARPSYSDYTSARELFAAVRDAAVEADRTRRMLLRLEASEGVKGQSYAAKGRSKPSDAMGRTDARIDYEERMRERLDEDYALMELGDRVLYGNESGEGGRDARLGSAYADVVWWRSCAAATWVETGRNVGYSASWCKDAYEAAMDVVDAHGFERTARGDGMGED